MEETYDPNRLVDEVIRRFGLKNDAAVCRALRVAPPVLSKIRRKKLSISSGLILRFHDVFGLDVDEVRKLMGVSAPKIAFKK